jgi:dsRNA-specific ribonuclease
MFGKTPRDVNRATKKQSFKEFIYGVLSLGNLTEKHKDEIWAEGSQDLLQAFTHETYGDGQDYNFFEFAGDTIVGFFVAFYIIERFPHIRNAKWTTRIKHNLISKRYLAQYAMNAGFFPYIRFGAKMQADIDENPDFATNIAYLSLLEDVLEAFFGALSMTIVKLGYLQGSAAQTCFEILRVFLDTREISLNYRDLFDPITRLKEFYEARNKPWEWSMSGGVYVENSVKNPDGPEVFTASVYGWPLGDKKQVYQNRVLLGKASAPNKQQAKLDASELALRTLADKYQIYEPIGKPDDVKVKKVR